jgi:hypothetical protein
MSQRLPRRGRGPSIWQTLDTKSFPNRSYRPRGILKRAAGRQRLGVPFQSISPRCREFPVFSPVFFHIRSVPGGRLFAACDQSAANWGRSLAHRFGEAVTEVVITASVSAEAGKLRSSRPPDGDHPGQGGSPLCRPLPPGAIRVSCLDRGHSLPKVRSFVCFRSFLNHLQPLVGG